jgi:hypothetical protein
MFEMLVELLENRIGSRDFAKQNSFNCHTWNGQAASGVGCETRKQRGFGAPEGGRAVSGRLSTID